MVRKIKNIDLFFDESGFTGSNLLDEQQPIFSVASSNIKEEKAEQILRSSFPNYKGKEFKFTNIWRSNSKDKLIDFIEHEINEPHKTFAYTIDKKFAVLTKISDFLIEPAITNAGYDFYDDGFCWKYTNYIYFGFTNFGFVKLLNSILYCYQNFSRSPNQDSLKNLQTQLAIMCQSIEGEVQIFLKQMHLGAILFEKFNNLDTFSSSNDLQLTTILALIASWRQKYDEDFNVYHDNSSNFFRKKELWEKITNPNVPKQKHKLGDGSYVEFPLRVISSTGIDSVNNFSVQYCDVIAGLVCKCFSLPTSKDEEIIISKIKDKGILDMICNGIVPSPIFPDKIPPKPLNGPDIIDQMVNIIYPK